MKTPENNIIDKEDSSDFRTSFEKKATTIFYPETKEGVNLDSKYAVPVVNKSIKESGTEEKARDILVSLQEGNDNPKKEIKRNKLSISSGVHTAPNHNQAHSSKKGFRKFFSNVKNIIGIGAVAAGVLTASSAFDNKSKTEKETTRNTLEYNSPIPAADFTYKKMIHSAQFSMNTRFSKELKAAGFDYIKIRPSVDGKGHLLEDGTLVFQKYKEGDPSMVIDEQEFNIPLSNLSHDSGHAFFEDIADKVRDALSTYSPSK